MTTAPALHEGAGTELFPLSAASRDAGARGPTLVERIGGARGRSGIRVALLAADLVGLATAFATAQLAAGGPAFALGPSLVFAALLPLWLAGAKLSGLFDRDVIRADCSTVDDLGRIFQLVTLSAFVLVGAGWAAGLNASPAGGVVFWASATPLVLAGRTVARFAARRRGAYVQNTLIVGAGAVGQALARKLLHHPEYGLRLVGLVDAAPAERASDLRAVPVLGRPEQLPELVRRHGVERVVFAFSLDPPESMIDVVRDLQALDVQVEVVPRFFEVVGPRATVHAVEGLSLVAVPAPRLSRSARVAKRAFDLAVGGAALILLAPVLAVIAAAIKLDSRGPAFFRQTRMGAGDRTFRIFKFRTMAVDADARKAEVAHLNKHQAEGGDPRMFKIPDDPRVTRVGRLLRAFSLDELPQLLNVLRGEMSLVGPRPLILDEDSHIEGWARRRLDLKPGVTGLWQVLGRSDIPFPEMLRLDYLYVTGWSLWNDVRLILRTLPVLAGRSHGAY